MARQGHDMAAWTDGIWDMVGMRRWPGGYQSWDLRIIPHKGLRWLTSVGCNMAFQLRKSLIVNSLSLDLCTPFRHLVARFAW